MAEVASLDVVLNGRGIAPAIDGLKKLEVQGRNTESAVSDLSTAFKVLAGAMVVRETAEAIKNAVVLAARYETLGATLAIMGNNTGKTGLEMQGFQKDLENTGISAIKARNSLQIMAAAQINVAKAADLGRVAQNAAVLANIDSSTAFQNLVRGIATGESRIIRHMGIMVNFGVAIDQEARRQGVLASSFSSTERAEIRLAAALAEGAKRAGVYEASMTTAGKQMLSMVRYTENLQVHLGETFNPATNALVFTLVDAFKEADAALKAWADSGGQASFAAGLAAELKAAIEWVRTFGSAIYNSAGMLVVLGGALAGLKLASWLQAATASLSVYHGKLLQGQALLINQRREELALAEAKLAGVAATRAATLAETAAHPNWFKSNALLAKMKLETDAVTAAELRLAAAKKATAVASGWAAREMSVASGIIGALGGPIGVAIMALTALAAAWMYFRDKTRENAEAASLSVNDAIKKNYEDAARAKEVLKLMKAGNTDKTAASKIEQIELGQLPQVLALQKSIVDLKEREEKLTKSISETNDKKFKANLTAARDELSEIIRVHNIDIKRIQDSEHYARKTKAALEEYGTAQAKARMALKDEMPESTSHTTAAFDRERAKYTEQIQLSKAIISGLSKEELKITKDKLDYERELSDIASKTLGKHPTLTKNEAARLGEEARRARDLRIEADKITAARERQAEVEERAQGIFEAYGTETENLERKLRQLYRTEAEIEDEEFGKKMLATEQATLETVNEMIVARQRARAELIAGMAAVEATREDEAYAERLNRNRRDGDTGTQLSALERAKNTGKLISDVYARTWIDIMMRGDTATSYIIQSTSKLFDSLGVALGNFATGTKYSFKELMSSLAADLARFYAQEAVKKLFVLLMGAAFNPAPTSSSTAFGGFTYTGSGAAGGMFGKAYGGPVSAGQGYIVGEKGPEKFFPGVSGQIVPNQGSPSGSVSVMVNVDANGVQTRQSGDHKDNLQQLGSIIGDSVRKIIFDEKLPGGLLYGS